MKEFVKDVMKIAALKLLRSYYNAINIDTRLIFPNRRQVDKSDKGRISEQELRFAFVEAFNELCKERNLDLFYAVEVPTKKKYRFKDCEPVIDEKNGRSGELDLVIYDSTKSPRILIEFKANNPRVKSYKKDIFKLETEKTADEAAYFIEILKNSDGDTKKSLKEKCICKDQEKIQFMFLSLEQMEILTLDNGEIWSVKFAELVSDDHDYKIILKDKT